VFKPLQFDDDTPQTVGMHRLAAVSGLLAGSKKLWAGVMMAEPGTTSSVHHHGAQETVVYVAEGKSLLRWGHRLEHESELEAGDFLLLPPYLPHQEINPSPDHHAMWIVVRSGAEAIVVDLVPGPDGAYVTPGSSTGRSAASAGEATRTLRRSSAAPTKTAVGRWENTRRDRTRWISLTLLVASAVAFVGAIVGEVWFGGVRRESLALLTFVLLALIGVADIFWAFHARTVRRHALFDAYAEREIARLSANRGRS
jgi:uncharacterized RmlC-like cupin family protein